MGLEGGGDGLALQLGHLLGQGPQVTGFAVDVGRGVSPSPARGCGFHPGSRSTRASCLASMVLASLRITACSSTLRSSRMLPRQGWPASRARASGASFGRRGAIAQGQVFAQGLDQRRDVTAPHPQRRHAHGQHMQAVEQVFAEPALAHQHTQIARSGGDDAHIKRHQLVAAQWLDLALLQRAQQLGLQTLRHVADFIEEQRAAIGQLELAVAPLAVGPGVGAGGHAEELGFEQRVGHRMQCSR